MGFFKNNPFIRLIIPLIMGIIIQYYLPLNKLIVFTFAISSTLAFVVSSSINMPYNLRYLRGIAINVVLISSGLLAVFLSHSTYHPINRSEKFMFLGEVIKMPDEQKNNIKTEIKLEAQKDGNYWTDVNSTVIAYIEKGDSLCSLKAGNKIVLYTQLNSIRGQQNPFGFDYAKYMALKNITETVYLRKGEWALLSEDARGLKNIALNLRQKIISEYEKQGITDDNLAVLSALTLGYKNKLDEKVRKIYSGAGAMHVLAVSGLHVGIIYIVLEILLSWFAIFSRLKKVKFILILLGLWGYAFLTGLSPSVLRATIMFSFVTVGKILDKRVSLYNSLAASAFLLLLINPLLLFEIGFQLSYVAVFGIVFFHPKINGWFYFSFKPFRWIWSLTALSIAAQLATFPITVYHFHLFPTYFWLTNIGVTLTAFVLMFISIFFIILSAMPGVSGIIAVILNFILKYNLQFIKWINELPGAIISNISFSTIQVFILYGIILVFAIWLLTKKYSALIVWMSCVLILGLYTLYEYDNRGSQNGLSVYQLKGETAIQFIHNKKSIWLISQKDEKSAINLIIDAANLYWKSTDNIYLNLETLNDTTIRNNNWYYNSGFWATKECNGLIINTITNLPQSPKDSLILDYIFVSGNPSFTINDLPDKIKFNKIVFDGSVPFWKTKQFISEKNNAAVYMTKDQGAFISVF